MWRLFHLLVEKKIIKWLTRMVNQGQVTEKAVATIKDYVKGFMEETDETIDEERDDEIVDEDDSVDEIVDEDDSVDEIVDEDDSVDEIVDEDDSVDEIVDEDDSDDEIVDEGDSDKIVDVDDNDVRYLMTANDSCK